MHYHVLALFPCSECSWALGNVDHLPYGDLPRTRLRHCHYDRPLESVVLRYHHAICFHLTETGFRCWYRQADYRVWQKLESETFSRSVLTAARRYLTTDCCCAVDCHLPYSKLKHLTLLRTRTLPKSHSECLGTPDNWNGAKVLPIWLLSTRREKPVFGYNLWISTGVEGGKRQIKSGILPGTI